MSGRIYLAEGEANECLRSVPSGSVRLASTSPRYLDLIDYDEGHEGWRPGRAECLMDYAEEHLATCRELWRVLAEDGTVAIEIDDYRVPREGRLILLSDLWAEMLQATGFVIAEKITLARTLALGHRSGKVKRYGGKAGYFLPDNVTSEIIVATKGNPLARIRRDATEADRVDLLWAERFLRNLWMVPPPNARRNGAHPVPQDAEACRAILSFYSVRGDVVLDPYAGSGTTGRLASELGRDAILFERVPRFAAEIRRTLGATPLERRGGRVQVASAQLWMELGTVQDAMIRKVYQERSRESGASLRLREIAARMSEATGVRIPPELAAIAMMAERERLAASRHKRGGRRRATLPR